MRFVLITVLTKHPVISILIFSSHLLWVSQVARTPPSGPYPLTFCNENFMLYLPCVQYAPPIPYWFQHIGKLPFRCAVQIMNFLTAVLCICLLISVSRARVYPTAAFICYLSFTRLLRLIAFSIYFIKYNLQRYYKCA